MLQPLTAGNASQCTIDFTFSVLKAPTKLDGAGQTDQLGGATGTNSLDHTGTGTGSGAVTVLLAAPTITTTAVTSATIGGVITDTAHLTAAAAPAPAPTGSIVFTAYGPQATSTPTCTGPAAYTSPPVTVSGGGSYTSPSTAPQGFTPAAPGTYDWIASYSGDANNLPAATACGDAGETTKVNPATPAIVTTASAAVNVGGTLSDTAVLSGGFNPTGAITFTLFGPFASTTPNCTGPSATLTVPVTHGNGTYPSGNFATTGPGNYFFEAAYSGDANNAAVTSACGAVGETSSVNLVTPKIVTTPSGSVMLGNTISDTATLSGSDAATGTITFNAYGPGAPTCAGAATFSSTVAVNGDGTYSSSPFVTTAATGAGTYHFVVTYSGDAANNAVSSACSAESVVVAPVTPTLVTTAAASPGTVGGSVTDIATLSGGLSPTGTITFDLFGPSANSTTCTAPPLATSTATVNGNGTYTSAPFTTTAPGFYNFEASYAGNGSNNPIPLTACGANGESVNVLKANPALTTQASAPVTVGNPISDTASLSGGSGPTGTITFKVFGPADATCSNAVAFMSVVPVAGNGNYLSGPFTPTLPGTYQFVDSYSGDANNNPAGPTACNNPAEAVVVSTSSPTIVTHASGSVAVGGTITDTATLAGGTNPTGNITFDVFGPGNATCTGIPAFVSVVAVTTGNGNYTSAPFTVPGAGTYEFVASYSGDTNNNPAGPTACNDPVETVTVTPSPFRQFTAVTPARDLDTRGGTGGTTGPVHGNTTFNVTVAGVNGVPASGVGAVALNVTVTNPTCAAWLTAFPAGQPVPASSNLNYTAGQTIANLVVVGVGIGGQVSFNVPAACAGSVQVIADVQGWYAGQTGTPPPGSYTPLTPARDLDTRGGAGGTTGPVHGNTTFNLTVAGVNGVPATGAGAVALNVTVTNPTCAAWLTAFPAGQPVPASSNLNYTAGQTIANLVIVGVGIGGQVSFNVPAACAGSIQVIADVQGWYAVQSGTPLAGSYTPLTPGRDVDTRSGTGGTTGPVRGNTTFSVTVAGVKGVPATGVGAVALNVTVTNPTCAAWVTVFPTGQPVPASSNLNYTAGQTIANLVIVGVGTGGQVSFNVPAACAGSIQVIADVQGWYST